MSAAKKLRSTPKPMNMAPAGEIPREAMDGQLLTAPAGTRLVTENELSRKMFIIRRGKVRVSKNYMGQRVTLAVLGEGEVFGELSFFDAAPRSASVDALTDIEVVIIDGKQAVEQVANLPSWVVPIFKTVFHRFRMADQKIAVLQSMNEFQKEHYKTDNVAKSVYLECLRFLRTLELLYTREQKLHGKVKHDTLHKELDEVLGPKRTIGLASFWTLLKEHDFIDTRLEEKKGEVKLDMDSIENWRTYLTREIEAERYLFVSHTAVALLRRLVGGLVEDANPELTTDDSLRTEQLDKFRVDGMPLYKEALHELQKAEVLKFHEFDRSISFKPAELIEVFHYQSMLKAFDHTIVSLD